MIGVIKNTKIFEFREETDLCQALSWFANNYGCDTLIITDTSDKVKAIISNDSFTFAPSIEEEQKYYVYGTTNGKYSELSKNDYLPNSYDWQLGPFPFAYTVQRVPKELDLY